MAGKVTGGDVGVSCEGRPIVKKRTVTRMEGGRGEEEVDAGEQKKFGRSSMRAGLRRTN